MDQRICIKFCVKNGIKCSKTLEMLKVAYGECTVSRKSVYKWYKLFTEGREEVNDDARPGQPSTSTTSENTKAVKKIVMENRRITIREVTEDVGISVGSCHAIFSDILGLKRVAAKFVPKGLGGYVCKSCPCSYPVDINTIDGYPCDMKSLQRRNSNIHF